MKKKDKLFIVANILTVIIMAFSIYSVISLFNYLNSLEIKWDNYTYQIVLQIIVSLILSILIFIVIYYVYHNKLNRSNEMIDELNNDNHNKNLAIEELNNRLAKSRLYDFSNKVWSIDILDEYIKQIYQKDVGVFTVVNIKSNSNETSKAFLQGMKLLNDPKVIVFRRSELEYTLLCIKLSNKDVLTNSSFFKANEITITSEYTFDTSKSNKDDVLNKIKGVSHE